MAEKSKKIEEDVPLKNVDVIIKKIGKRKLKRERLRKIYALKSGILLRLFQ